MTELRRFQMKPTPTGRVLGQQAIFSLNDLIHPETIESMTGQSVTSQPLYDGDPRGCGCVR